MLHLSHIRHSGEGQNPVLTAAWPPQVDARDDEYFKDGDILVGFFSLSSYADFDPRIPQIPSVVNLGDQGVLKSI